MTEARLYWRDARPMTKRNKPQTTTRPRMPRAPEEMRQWSELLMAEALRWQNTSSRPMFGMTALYRGKTIFAALPRTRAIGTRHSIAFKLPRRSEVAEADMRIITDRPGAKWLTFELNSGEDIPDALRWLEKAYEQARTSESPRRITNR
jgi:hypothetical protein